MQALQTALEPGDVVMTTSGLRATVVDASYEETVDLEIADGVVTTWVRAAVREKVRRADATRRDTTSRRRRADAGRGPIERRSHPRLVAAEGRLRRTAPVARTDPPQGSGHDPRQEENSTVATTPGRIRPWRYLAAFAGVVVVLYALVFFTGDGRATPKLGIDLQGGTRVTLVARTESGAEPPREQLVQAQQIIEERVNGLGVSGAEVVLDGTNLTITVPGQEGEQARSLGQTAQLRFREVIGVPDLGHPARCARPPDPPVTGGHGRPGRAGDRPPAPAPADRAAPRPARRARPAPGGGRPAAPRRRAAVAPVAVHLAGRRPRRPTPTPAAPAPGARARLGAAPARPPGGRRRRPRPTRDSPRPSRRPGRPGRAPTPPSSRPRSPRWTAPPRTRCAATTTRPCRWWPASRTAPRSTCSARVFLEGTQIDTAMAQQNAQGAGWVISLTFKSEGAAIWGDYTVEEHRQERRVRARRRGRLRPDDQQRDLRHHRDLRASSTRPRPSSWPACCATARCRCRSSRPRRRPSRPPSGWPRWRPG